MKVFNVQGRCYHYEDYGWLTDNARSLVINYCFCVSYYIIVENYELVFVKWKCNALPQHKTLSRVTSKPIYILIKSVEFDRTVLKLDLLMKAKLVHNMQQLACPYLLLQGYSCVRSYFTLNMSLTTMPYHVHVVFLNSVFIVFFLFSTFCHLSGKNIKL